MRHINHYILLFILFTSTSLLSNERKYKDLFFDNDQYLFIKKVGDSLYYQSIFEGKLTNKTLKLLHCDSYEDINILNEQQKDSFMLIYSYVYFDEGATFNTSIEEFIEKQKRHIRLEYCYSKYFSLESTLNQSKSAIIIGSGIEIINCFFENIHINRCFFNSDVSIKVNFSQYFEISQSEAFAVFSINVTPTYYLRLDGFIKKNSFEPSLFNTQISDCIFHNEFIFSSFPTTINTQISNCTFENKCSLVVDFFDSEYLSDISMRGPFMIQPHDNDSIEKRFADSLSYLTYGKISFCRFKDTLSLGCIFTAYTYVANSFCEKAIDLRNFPIKESPNENVKTKYLKEFFSELNCNTGVKLIVSNITNGSGICLYELGFNTKSWENIEIVFFNETSISKSQVLAQAGIEFDKIISAIDNDKSISEDSRIKLLNWINYQRNNSRYNYLCDNAVTIRDYFEFIRLYLFKKTVNYGYNGGFNFSITLLLVTIFFTIIYLLFFIDQINYYFNSLLKEKNYSKFYFREQQSVFIKIIISFWFSCLIITNPRLSIFALKFSPPLFCIVIAEWTAGIVLLILLLVYIIGQYPFIKQLIG